MIPDSPRLVKPSLEQALERLTDRQLAVYGFIVRFKLHHDGCAPKIREIMDGLDIPSTSSVAYTLRRLEDAGLIRLHENQPRRIEVVGGVWSAPEWEAM
jgi:SOS-response transcriptional repressor LexA